MNLCLYFFIGKQQIFPYFKALSERIRKRNTFADHELNAIFIGYLEVPRISASFENTFDKEEYKNLNKIKETLSKQYTNKKLSFSIEALIGVK